MPTIESRRSAIGEIPRRGGFVIRMGDGETAPLLPLANVIDYRHSDMRDSQLRRMAQLEKRVLAYIRRNQLQHDDGRGCLSRTGFHQGGKYCDFGCMEIRKSASP